MNLDDAFALFRRLGVDPSELDEKELQTQYFRLAKQYHPDVRNQPTDDLMANINVARDTIRAAYRSN